MINLRKCYLPFTCTSCKKFVHNAKSLIEVQYDQSEDPNRLYLCEDCQLELARRILFQRGREHEEVVDC